jgi:NAD+ synthase
MAGKTLSSIREALTLDPQAEVERIATWMRQAMRKDLHRQGAVVGLSGGVDSSVTAALCVRALGESRIFGLLMPEADSAPETTQLGRQVAQWLQIPFTEENITPVLQGLGCYQRQQDAIREVIPQFGPEYKFKLVLDGSLESEAHRLFYVVAQNPAGDTFRARLTPAAYLGLVAATNFKQRVRKMLEYYHADRLNYAVAGTPNRLEYDQGFFVKQGDGAADLKPIAHLYKSQVYQLAEYLGVPAEIISRPPTTDTYSLPQSQEEFFFVLPYQQLDLCLFGLNHGLKPEEVARETGLTGPQVARVYRDIEAKRRTTRYLQLPPLLVEAVHGE